MTITSFLPELPSALIRVALADLALVEADPRYKVDMGVFHQNYGGICHVCLAGAVMAKTLNLPVSRQFVSDLDEAPKLFALDNFRVGSIAQGLRELDMSHPPELATTFPVIGYSDNPVQFRSEMGDLATLFEEYGL